MTAASEAETRCSLILTLRNSLSLTGSGLYRLPNELGDGARHHIGLRQHRHARLHQNLRPDEV